jgi:hypothetical protein
VFDHHPCGRAPAVVLSEDGKMPAMAEVLANYAKTVKLRCPDLPIVHLHHPRNPAFAIGYIKLAEHYRWALNQVRAIRVRISDDAASSGGMRHLIVPFP